MGLIRYRPSTEGLQRGGGFQGELFQRGFGFSKIKGRILSSPFYQKIKPAVQNIISKTKPVAKKLGNEMLKAGRQSIKEMLINKESPKSVFGKQKEALKRKITNAAIDALSMSGDGIKRKKQLSKNRKNSLSKMDMEFNSDDIFEK